MGKCLSIPIITLSIYNIYLINGYSSINNKQKEQDELKAMLPPYLKHLSGYVQKRTEPLRSPQEIERINQAIFSRHLLGDQFGMNIYCQNAYNGGDSFTVTLESDGSSDMTVGTLANAIIEQGNIIGYGPSQLLISYSGQELTDHTQLLADSSIGSEASIEFKPDPRFSIKQVRITGLDTFDRTITLTTEIPLGHGNLFEEITRQVRQNPEIIDWISLQTDSNGQPMPLLIQFSITNKNFPDIYYPTQRCSEDEEEVEVFKLGSDIHAHYYSQEYVDNIKSKPRMIAGKDDKIMKMNKYENVQSGGVVQEFFFGEIQSGPYYWSDLYCYQLEPDKNWIEFWYDLDDKYDNELCNLYFKGEAWLISIEIVIEKGMTMEFS